MHVLTVVQVHFGYCHQCERPTTVARCVVAGWAHQFSICSSCLHSLAQRLDNVGLAPSEEPGSASTAR